MPFAWNTSSERQLLLLAIIKSDLNPSSEVFSSIAEMLGEKLTKSAVSQKFRKLKIEHEGLSGSSTSSSTPSPRKRKAADGSIKKSEARPKMKLKKEEPVSPDFSNESTFSEDNKTMAQKHD